VKKPCAKNNQIQNLKTVLSQELDLKFPVFLVCIVTFSLNSLLVS
jgi:hypothetical protein